MTKCDRYHEFLMRRFDHELEGDDREALDRHLDSCRHCQALSEDLTGILDVLEEAVPVEPDADLERLVLNRVMSLPAYGETGRGTLSRTAYGTVAGLAAALFVVLGSLFQHMGYTDLILAARDFAYWTSALLVNLQIAGEIVSGLFYVDVFEISREVLAVFVLTAFVLLAVAVKAALSPTRDPDMPLGGC